MASEIGGMRQKEHIDAMEIMGVNTAAYLIMPKILAAVVIIPILVAIAAFVSIGGGFIAAVPTGPSSGMGDVPKTVVTIEKMEVLAGPPAMDAPAAPATPAPTTPAAPTGTKTP